MASHGTKADELPVIILTRAQLFERVWTTPRLRLAQEFGISDVALAKLCRRRRIPCPPRGYWAKRAAGQSPVRRALPPAVNGEDRPAILRPVAAIPAFPIPALAERLHPLAERLRHRLRCYKKDHVGLVHVNERGLPRVAVSPAQVERVAGAVHVLLKEAEAGGFIIRFAGEDGQPELCRDRRRTVIWVQEELSADLASSGRRVRQPTGRLRFFLGSANRRAERARSWTESDTLSLELVLGRIVAALTPLNTARHAMAICCKRFEVFSQETGNPPLKVA